MYIVKKNVLLISALSAQALDLMVSLEATAATAPLVARWHFFDHDDHDHDHDGGDGGDGGTSLIMMIPLLRCWRISESLIQIFFQDALWASRHGMLHQ